MKIGRRVTAIRIPARYQLDDAGAKVATATFKLGVGPCGREVVELDYIPTAGSIRIIQTHGDGSSVDFIYPHAQLTGRIEVTYA